MNEILQKLRNELNALILVIDNYQPIVDEVIIINKEDLKYLKWKIFDTNSLRNHFSLIY